MSSAVELLLSDSALINKIGLAARESIESKYTWNKVCDRIINCYQSLLS
jgi:glycosyltransferase involved in cell wall biosynthesis